MKFSLLCIFIFLSGMLQAQEHYEVQYFNAALKPGQFLEFENKSVKFKEVIADSRCPKGVTCIWAGNAKVLVEIFENGEKLGEKILTLPSGTPIGNPLEIFSGKADFWVSVQVLHPYPDIDTTTDPSDYHLQLQVKKLLKLE